MIKFAPLIVLASCAAVQPVGDEALQAGPYQPVCWLWCELSVELANSNGDGDVATGSVTQSETTPGNKDNNSDGGME